MDRGQALLAERAPDEEVRLLLGRLDPWRLELDPWRLELDPWRLDLDPWRLDLDPLEAP
ncbi:MAG TPA: hypothetical protein VE093_20155 [Polyangiaceae bacterium]|nr:hypothetical protein [Polyangiaceae bacterium]